MIHRIGGTVLSGVRMTSRAYEDDGVRLTFYFDDGYSVPVIDELPAVLDIVADGQSLGCRRVCCTGRSVQPGSAYFMLKWRDG